MLFKKKLTDEQKEVVERAKVEFNKYVTTANKSTNKGICKINIQRANLIKQMLDMISKTYK